MMFTFHFQPCSGCVHEIVRLPVHRPLLRRHVPRGRRDDLHGGDGHQSGQVLREGVCQQQTHSGRCFRKNRVLGMLLHGFHGLFFLTKCTWHRTILTKWQTWTTNILLKIRQSSDLFIDQCSHDSPILKLCCSLQMSQTFRQDVSRKSVLP